MTFELIETTVHLAVVKRLGALADTLEEKGLWVHLGVHAKNVEGDTRGRAVVAATDDVAVADDEDELPFIIVVERGKGVNRSAKGVLAFRVTRDLAKYELVLEFWVALTAELQRSQDYRRMELLTSENREGQKAYT